LKDPSVLISHQPALMSMFASMITVIVPFSTNVISIGISAKCTVRCSALHSSWHSSAACRIADGLSSARARLKNMRELFTRLLLAETCFDVGAASIISVWFCSH